VNTIDCCVVVTGIRTTQSELVILTIVPDLLAVTAVDAAGKFIIFPPGKFFSSVPDPTARVISLTPDVPYIIAWVAPATL